jgi:hypothetical protein
MEDSDFNINTVAADFLSQQLDAFVRSMQSAGKSVSEKIRLQFITSFKTYVEALVARHSFARSFFNRTEAAYLYSFYVPIGIKTQKTTISRANSREIFTVSRNVVIQGTGGCGKTVLMKHLILDVLHRKEKIPIFLELREMNKNGEALDTLLHNSLKSSGLIIGEESFKKSLDEGLFSIFLDGFDELEKTYRNAVSARVRAIASDSSGTQIVITSRPDNEFSGWSEFSIFTAIPLSLDQAIELVEKTPINKELKGKFIEDLKQHLFKKHFSFLSNPLLLSIMLLTYHDSADIPKKLTVFYNLAYEALFQRHDAWKGGYLRQRATDLDIHDFARVLAAFSILSYDKRVFSFSKIEAVKLLKQAREITNLDFDAETYLLDASQAVCILIEEGMQISYSHRSFQEYFAARFIADAPPSSKIELLHRFSSYVKEDSVVSLLHEIQPKFVETHLILPILKQLFSEIKLISRKVTKAVHLRYIKNTYRAFRIGFDLETEKVQIYGELLPKSKSRHIERFCLSKCSNTNALKNFNRNPIFQKYLDKEHDGKEKIIKVSSLTTKNELFLMIYNSNNFFSPEVLCMLWDVAIGIEERNKQSDVALDEILKGSKLERKGLV